MPRAFQVFFTSLRDCFDEFLLLTGCNIIWSLLSMPLVIIALLAAQAQATFIAALLALLAALPLGPASAGLAVVAHRISDGRATSFRDFFGGMRSYARPSWLFMGVWMLGLLIILVDIAFYAQVDNLVGAVLYGIWVYLLLVWMCAQIYLFPLLMFQERPDLRIVARNIFVMVVGRPIFTLVTLVLMSLIVALSYVLLAPLFVFTFALLAVWGSRATRTLIEDDKARREAALAAQSPPSNLVEEKGRRGQVRPK